MSEPERVSPDDPIIHGLRWRQERDEARRRAEEAEAWAMRLYGMLSTAKKAMVFHEIQPVLIRARGGQ